MLIKRQEYFFVPLIFLLGMFIAVNFIPMIAAVLVAAFAVSLSAYQYFLTRNIPLGFYLCWVIAIVLGVVVGLYRPIGFNYPLVFSVNQLYEGGLPLSLYVNTAKLLAGYIILCFLLVPGLVAQVYIRARLHQYFLAMSLGLLVTGTAYVFLGLQVYVKAINYIVLFAIVNLLVTCVAEEAFMRLLLQAQLQGFVARVTNNRYVQELIPLLIATLVFVATHFTHNFSTTLVFALAGFVYGLVYCLTKNLWACVLVHFVVNIVHFSFLTYPLA